MIYLLFKIVFLDWFDQHVIFFISLIVYPIFNRFMFKERAAGFTENGHELPSCFLNQWYPGQAILPH